jgi:hypothetical protein
MRASTVVNILSKEIYDFLLEREEPLLPNTFILNGLRVSKEIVDNKEIYRVTSTVERDSYIQNKNVFTLKAILHYLKHLDSLKDKG